MTCELVERVEVPTRPIGIFERFGYFADGRHGCIGDPFGPALIGDDGALDRAAMRERVFRDASARQRLEAIIHPLVGQETDR